ncbi:hypothetical protein BJ508DRAFT_330514 [Ascobolus immersus RN42]|uniref:Uncharacterized protein n=1 Tax=Ascobolus immersus RN42 TaxID=1160509 RepID=A0A3N4I5F9_ASCIM|nr:hypothetical protein BJ508DRAFT_330514 [Ascobolus immersus RN42]
MPFQKGQLVVVTVYDGRFEGGEYPLLCRIRKVFKGIMDGRYKVRSKEARIRDIVFEPEISDLSTGGWKFDDGDDFELDDDNYKNVQSLIEAVELQRGVVPASEADPERTIEHCKPEMDVAQQTPPVQPNAEQTKTRQTLSTAPQTPSGKSKAGEKIKTRQTLSAPPQHPPQQQVPPGRSKAARQTQTPSAAPLEQQAPPGRSKARQTQTPSAAPQPPLEQQAPPGRSKARQTQTPSAAPQPPLEQQVPPGRSKIEQSNVRQALSAPPQHPPQSSPPRQHQAGQARALSAAHQPPPRQPQARQYNDKQTLANKSPAKRPAASGPLVKSQVMPANKKAKVDPIDSGLGFENSTDNDNNVPVASQASILSEDYYPSDDAPEWLQMVEDDVVLENAIESIQYAIKYGFPSLQRLDRFADSAEVCYYRIKKIPGILDPENGWVATYRRTSFYWNFRQRYQQRDVEPVYKYPDSADEEEKAKGLMQKKYHHQSHKFRAQERTKKRNELESTFRASEARLPYHDRKYDRTPFGYYDHAKHLILECISDPRFSSIYPAHFYSAYSSDSRRENRFATFQVFCMEVIVPMVIRAWIWEDLRPTGISIAAIESIVYSRRAKIFSSLLTNTAVNCDRLVKCGLVQLVRRREDVKWLKKMEDVEEGVVEGGQRDGNVRAKPFTR